jgi:hypothetical protein
LKLFTISSVFYLILTIKPKYMKLLLTFISMICLSIGLSAKPEKKGKGDKSGRPSREEILKKFDKDGDGNLSDEEKAEIRKTMANRTPPAHILEKFDKDGDGKLSDEEKAGMRKEMMAKFDKDGDGKLSPDERKAAIEARSKGAGGKGKKAEGKGKGKGKKTEGKKKKES